MPRVPGNAPSAARARACPIGRRLAPAVRAGSGFEPSLDARRREAANDNGPERGIIPRGPVRW